MPTRIVTQLAQVTTDEKKSMAIGQRSQRSHNACLHFTSYVNTY